MTTLLKRLHQWLGLFSLTALVVFALTGLASLLPAKPATSAPARIVPYHAPPAFTDKQIADDLFDRLQLPEVGRIPEWAIERNDADQLELAFNGVNGTVVVTVDEVNHRVLVVEQRASLRDYIGSAHATTVLHAAPDLRVRLWGAYVTFAIGALLFLSVSGVWLWLASRPRLWWAWLLAGSGSGLVALLWVVTR